MFLREKVPLALPFSKGETREVETARSDFVGAKAGLKRRGVRPPGEPGFGASETLRRTRKAQGKDCILRGSEYSVNRGDSRLIPT